MPRPNDKWSRPPINDQNPMKKIISTLTCLLLIQFAFGQNELNWLTNYDDAVATAQKENKTVLMSFSGSDWCSNCMRLDKDLFQQEAFATYAKENLILLKLDFPAKKKNMLPAEQKAHNEELAEKYNKKGVFPQVLIINLDGSVAGAMEHPASTPEAYINSIKTLIKK